MEIYRKGITPAFVPLDENYKKPLIKRFELYNAGSALLHINPLDEIQEKHSGSIINPNQNDDIKNVSMIRFMFTTHKYDMFDFLCRPFYIGGEKVNMSTFFSENQFQGGILSVPLNNPISIEKLNLKVPLKWAEFCNVSLFDSHNVTNNTDSTLRNFPDKEAYVVIDNSTLDSFEVNLVDLMRGINIPEGITVTNSKYMNGDFSLMSIFSKSTQQLIQLLKYNEEDVKPEEYFSAIQFQSFVVRCAKNFKITDATELKVLISGNATVMYHFM